MQREILYRAMNCTGMRGSLICLVIIGCLYSSVIKGTEMSDIQTKTEKTERDSQKEKSFKTEPISGLNGQLKMYLQINDLTRGREVAEKIIGKINSGAVTDSVTLIGSYYLIGLQYLFTKKYDLAIKYLQLAAGLKESRKEVDEKYANTLYNLGVAYFDLGDFSKQERYSVNSLEIEKKIYGVFQPFAD